MYYQKTSISQLKSDQKYKKIPTDYKVVPLKWYCKNFNVELKSNKDGAAPF